MVQAVLLRTHNLANPMMLLKKKKNGGKKASMYRKSLQDWGQKGLELRHVDGHVGVGTKYANLCITY